MAVTTINRPSGVPRLRIKAGPQRDKYVHTLVAEAMLGRYLRADETVEHVDGNSLNNEWTNLRIVPRAENSRLRWVRERGKAAR